MLRKIQLRRRTGAIVPLFAILTPVIILACGMAINVAYMHLVQTELKIATDISARAGGKAFSHLQDVNLAVYHAKQAAAENMVAGLPLNLDDTEAASQIEFGIATRPGGAGRYQFTPKTRADVINHLQAANSVRINAIKSDNTISGSVRMMFSGIGPFSQFTPSATSIATQIDRDIALVLDVSGSMAYEVEDYGQYYEIDGSGNMSWNNTVKQAEYEEWQADYSVYQANNHSIGPVPRHSRWVALRDAVNEFLDILEQTEPIEYVSLSTFASSGNLRCSANSSYSAIRNYVASALPKGSTNIGGGMQVGESSIVNNSSARQFAQKFVIVFTDGVNNAGSSSPATVAQNIVDAYPTQIHTITFSAHADQSAMQSVADIGGGQHFHADNAAQLAAAFEEIANNLPTILVE